MVIAYLIGAGLSSIIWAVLLSVLTLYVYGTRRQLIIVGAIAVLLWPVTWIAITTAFILGLCKKTSNNVACELSDLLHENIVDITYECPSKLVVLLQNGSELRYAIDNDKTRQGPVTVVIQNIPQQGMTTSIIWSREEKWEWLPRKKRTYIFSVHPDNSSPRVTLGGKGHPYLRKQE